MGIKERRERRIVSDPDNTKIRIGKENVCFGQINTG